jgi:hydroxymethylpyrimidine pyrophosphatase-like HAD family hydrolase
MSSATRLVVTDLDGTLLDPAGRLSPRTRQVVDELRRRGVSLALATSRRLSGVWAIAQELGGPLWLIVYDGALTQAYPTARVLAQRTLPPAQGQRAAQIMAEAGLQPIAQHAGAAGEQLLVAPNGGHSAWADDYLSRNAQQVEYVPVARLCAGQPQALRLVAFGPVRRIRTAARAVARELAVGEAIKSEAVIGTQVLPLGSYGAAELTVFAAGVSKGSAMSQLAVELGIPLSQVLAVGDGLNDVSMLRIAGTSVAMAGAPPVVLRAARHRAGSNAEDGAARALERFVLDQEDDLLEDAGA